MNKWIITVLALALSGCAHIVKKPEIDSVKKIGVVSVYSNKGLHYFKDNKVTQVDSPWDMATSALNLGSGIKSAFDARSNPLLDSARKDIEGEFKKLNRFDVVPFEDYAQKPAYRNFAASTGQKITNAKSISIGSFISKPNQNFDVAPGMRAVEGLWLNQGPINQENVKELADLAKQLGLDGVIVARYELGYRDPMFMSFSITAGSLKGSQAEASVAGTLVLVTKDRTFGIVTPDFKDGAGSRETSDKRFKLVNGKAVPGEELNDAMKEAIQKATAGLKDKIAKEL